MSVIQSTYDRMMKNKSVKEFAHKLGFGKSDADKAAEADLAASKQAYQELKPPTLTPEIAQNAQAFDAEPSSFDNISTNPAYKNAQLEQLGALRNLAANGGRNAASDANLARIQQAENANARGQRDAILQNANARGVGGSGASLLAQLSSSQNQTNNQSAQDMDIAGQQANTALQAGAGAANIGSNMQNTEFGQKAAKAQADDAIAKFNAGQRTGISSENAGINNNAQQYNTGLEQTGYQNQYQKQAGIAGSNMSGVNYNQAQANMGAQQAGNMTGGAIKTVAAIYGGGAAKAASGGKIPGKALVSGDSRLNDIVPVDTSPGEVVVPRSLAKSGDDDAIASFVKHPPKVKMGGQDKEAMLSALKNIRKRAM